MLNGVWRYINILLACEVCKSIDYSCEYVNCESESYITLSAIGNSCSFSPIVPHAPNFCSLSYDFWMIFEQEQRKVYVFCFIMLQQSFCRFQFCSSSRCLVQHLIHLLIRKQWWINFGSLNKVKCVVAAFFFLQNNYLSALAYEHEWTNALGMKHSTQPIHIPNAIFSLSLSFIWEIIKSAISCDIQSRSHCGEICKLYQVTNSHFPTVVPYWICSIACRIITVNQIDDIVIPQGNM